MKRISTNQLLAMGMALNTDRAAMEQRVRGVFARKSSSRPARALTLALCLLLVAGCFTTACQPAQETLASPGSAAVSPGNALVSPGDALASPGNALASPGNALASAGNASIATPGNAVQSADGSYNVTRVDGNTVSVDASVLESGLTQEKLEAIFSAFFAGQDARYFSYSALIRSMYQNMTEGLDLQLKSEDAGSAERAERYRACMEAYKSALESASDGDAIIWLDQPLIGLSDESGGKVVYEIVDAKAYADGKVYDTWYSRDLANACFSFGVYGRNQMTHEEIEAMSPSDGIAWLSMMQGVNDELTTEAQKEQAAAAALPRAEAIQKALAILEPLGLHLNEAAVSSARATYRLIGMPQNAEGEPQDYPDAVREYGWLITFCSAVDTEAGLTDTITVGVLPSGYGQFSWERGIG